MVCPTDIDFQPTRAELRPAPLLGDRLFSLILVQLFLVEATSKKLKRSILH
jgi:hypothetical protein